MPKSAIAPVASASELAVSTAAVIAETVKLLVDDPARVAVEGRANPTKVTLFLKVAPGDLGKVIGKQGRTARSLRILLSSMSRDANIRIDLDIQPNTE